MVRATGHAGRTRRPQTYRPIYLSLFHRSTRELVGAVLCGAVLTEETWATNPDEMHVWLCGCAFQGCVVLHGNRKSKRICPNAWLIGPRAGMNGNMETKQIVNPLGWVNHQPSTMFLSYYATRQQTANTRHQTPDTSSSSSCSESVELLLT